MIPKFLTSNYPLEKHFFLIPWFGLNLIGFYPESKKTILLQLWALFNISILAYGCYAELYYGIHYLSIDVVEALDALCPVASSLMSLLKIFYIGWYREEFRVLIERVRQLLQEQNSPEKTVIKKFYLTNATRLTAALLFFGFCTSTSYSIRAMIANILRYLQGKSVLYETPFKMIFPKRLLSMPIFPVTFGFVHWHGYITVVSFVGADGFFLGFCFYFTVLLQSIQKDLVLVLKENNTIGQTPAAKEKLERKVCDELAAIINRHNEIDDLIKKFSAIMVEITLGHFVSSSIIIGTSIIDMLLFSGYGIMVYVVYTLAVLTELFIYCLGGNLVIETSASIATTAYCSAWYTYSAKVQKMVWLIMTRAQRNFVVRVPFFAPSLPTLTSILRFTGSLIALAKSIL